MAEGNQLPPRLVMPLSLLCFIGLLVCGGTSSRIKNEKMSGNNSKGFRRSTAYSTKAGLLSNSTNNYTSPSALLKNYEIVEQQIKGLHNLPNHQKVTVLFRAYKKDFVLDIETCKVPKPTVHVIKSDGRKEAVDSIGFVYYCGHLRDSTYFVHGRIERNIFYGAVHYKNEVYYIDHLAGNTGNGNCMVYKNVDIDLTSLNLTRGVDERLNYLQFFHQKTASKSQRKERSRPKRRADEGLSCPVRVYVDVNFFVNMADRNVYDTLGKIYYYIMESNRIFVNTDFDSDGHADGIGIVLADITITENAAAMWALNLSPFETDASTVLEQFSILNHDRYCLSALFTHRDLNGGIIGLAWLATSSPYGSPGGVCQRRIYNGKSFFNFNTFLVTSLNNGRTLLDSLIALTVTHELGHAFGSPHDPQENPYCSPGGNRGYYLMHPRSTDGSRPNNAIFSQCSRDHISPVIQNKGDCFVEANIEYCGDGVLQGEEECDCGSPEKCQLFDPCCNSPTNFETACKLLNSSYCSPAVNSCCSHQCDAVSVAEGKICHPASACMKASICDGVGYDCPDSIQEPDGSLCDLGTALCKDGICSESRCSVLGLEKCDCSGALETHCQLCCSSPIKGCVPIQTLGIKSSTGGPMLLISGSPCLGDTGYCDRNSMCVRSTKIDTLRRIKELLNSSMPKRLRNWFSEHLIFTLVAALIVALLMLSSVILYRINRSVPIQSLARHTARMAVLWQQAYFELLLVSDQIEEIDAKYQEALINSKNMPRDSVEQFITLCKLFPKAPRNLIESLMENSNDNVVHILLERGYSMHQLPTCASNIEHGLRNNWIKGYKRGDLIHTI